MNAITVSNLAGLMLVKHRRALIASCDLRDESHLDQRFAAWKNNEATSDKEHEAFHNLYGAEHALERLREELLKK